MRSHFSKFLVHIAIHSFTPALLQNSKANSSHERRSAILREAKFSSSNVSALLSPPRGSFDRYAPAILLDDPSRGFQESGVGGGTVLSSRTGPVAIFLNIGGGSHGQVRCVKFDTTLDSFFSLRLTAALPSRFVCFYKAFIIDDGSDTFGREHSGPMASCCQPEKPVNF